MSADHDHSQHHHDHAIKLKRLNTAFIVGIILNAGFVIVEGVIGFSKGSLSLLTDAGHNLSDVASLALALLAFKLTKVKSNKQYTYGYKRSTILVSLVNAVLLLAAVAIIAYEAVTRFSHPQPVSGTAIAWVAFIGIGINGFTAWLFIHDKEKDLNVKGAYLHMMVDALVSLGVAISGIVIYYTQWWWLDGAVSLVIVLVIVSGTWRLLKDSLRLEMDGVPDNIELEEIKQEILKIKSIKDVHHLHVWALSTTENALTAHLILDQAGIASFADIKADLRHRLQHMEISHCTFEPELLQENCHEHNCSTQPSEGVVHSHKDHQH